MTAVLIALNIIAGLFLVAVVLLQAGKGADMGAAFGGANPAAFGPAAQGNVLQKITAAKAPTEEYRIQVRRSQRNTASTKAMVSVPESTPSKRCPCSISKSQGPAIQVSQG